MSVDLTAGIFHCFGCGQQGGIKRFAALVGETNASSEQPTNEPPSCWHRAMRLAAHHAWRRDGVDDLYVISDYIRRERQRITRVRSTANEDSWDALADAADAERFVNALEATLDLALETWHP